MEKEKAKKKSTDKKTPTKKTKVIETSSSKGMTMKFNRDSIGVLLTVVVVVAVAAFSFFLAFSLRRDVGTSIPNDFSRYIASDFVIGFPGGWQISSGSVGGFSAAQVDEETGESNGSVTVTSLSMQDILVDGFTGYDDDGCEGVKSYLAEQQETLTGSEFDSSESKSIDVNGSDACQIDTVEINTLDDEDTKIHTRYLIVEKDGIDESYVVVGYWIEENDFEDDITLSLRTFEVIEQEDKEKDETKEEESSEDETESNEDESTEDDSSESTEDSEE